MTKLRLDTTSLPLDHSKIAVALSGGLDSVVLTHLVKNQFPKSRIVALHVNYGLRGRSSDLDQKFCEKYCKSLEIELHVTKLSKTEIALGKKKSTQEWARSIRYDIFEEWKEKGFIIALGHHRNDLVENFVFRLLRGHSATDLLGMTVYKDQFWRPLLTNSKSDLLTYAKGNKLKYREDASNFKSSYTRNFIRNKILPLIAHKFPSYEDSLLRTGELSQDLGTYFLETTTEIWSQPALSMEKLSSFPESLRFVLLKQYVWSKSSGQIFINLDQAKVILGETPPNSLDLSPHWKMMRKGSQYELKQLG